MKSLAALLFHPSASAEKPDKARGPKQADSFAQVLRASLGDSRRDSRSGLTSAPAAEISPETQGTPPSSRAAERGQAEDTLVAPTTANPRRTRSPSEAQGISGAESTGKEKSARAHQGASKLQRARRGYAVASSAPISDAPAAPTRRADTSRSLPAPPLASTTSDQRAAAVNLESATQKLRPQPSTQARKPGSENRARADQQKTTVPIASAAPAVTEPSGEEHMPPNTSAVHHAPANPHPPTSRPGDEVRSQAWTLVGEGLDAGARTPRETGALAVPCGHLVPVDAEVPSSLPVLADSLASQPERLGEQVPIQATGPEAPVETPVLVTPVDLDAVPPQAANHFTPGENPWPQANQKAVEHANFRSAVRVPSRPIDLGAPHTPAALTTEPPSQPQPRSEAPTTRSVRHDGTVPAKHFEPKADGASQGRPVHTSFGPRIEAAVQPSTLDLISNRRTTAPSKEDHLATAPTKSSPSANVLVPDSEPLVTLPRPPSSSAQGQAIPAARLGQAPEKASSSPAPQIFAPVSTGKTVANHGTHVSEVASQPAHERSVTLPLSKSPQDLPKSTIEARPAHGNPLPAKDSVPGPLPARPHDTSTQARTPVPPAVGQTAVADRRPGEPQSEPPRVPQLNHGAQVTTVAREARGDGASEPSIPKSPQGLVHESQSEQPEIRELNHGARVAIVAHKAESKPASPPAAPTPSVEPVTIVVPTPVVATPVAEPTSLPHHEGQAEPVVLTGPGDHPAPQPKADHAARPAHQAPRSAHPGWHPHSEKAAKPIEASAPPSPQVESKPEPTSTAVESDGSVDTAPVAAPVSAPQGDAAPLPISAAPSPPALAVAPVPADKPAPRSDANAPAVAPVATVLPATPGLPTPAEPAAPPSSKVEAPQTHRRLWTAKDDPRFPEAPAFPAPAPQPQSTRPHAPTPIPGGPDGTQNSVASPNPHASPVAAAALSPDRPADLPVPPAPTSTSPSDVSALTSASAPPPAPHVAPVEVRQPQLPSHVAPLAAQAVRDDGLNLTVMPHAVHMSIESSDGDLALHLRVRDGSADVTVGGSMAPLFEARAPEARAALASEGLNLGRFDLGQQGGGGRQGQPAPERPEPAPEPATPYRHQSSPGEPKPGDGRIHVTA